MRARLGSVVFLAALIMLGSMGTAAHAADPGAGQVRMVKRTDSAFDRFTSNPTDAQKQWMRDKYWRMEVFAPYWDSKQSWYPSGWFYQDLYAIYTGSAVARDHPDWILKDANGNNMYIPWGCSGGTCPQYAADPGNPDFRRWWIDQAKANLAKGYKGIWVDDVNMEFRVGNGNGDETAPRDPRTGATMSYANWRRYIAEFTEQLAGEVPQDTEILHNSIWYGGNSVGRDSDPYVKRQIRSADYINIERGVNDGGLTGGTGSWSLSALQSFIDRVQAEGKGVVLDGWTDTDAEREYGLANYFLISSGRDGIGNYAGSHPDDWWKGYDVSLGAPQGRRYAWNGLIRRDFERGVVLANEPGAPTRTVQPGAGLFDVDGRERQSVSLAAGRGMVLTSPAGQPPAAGGTTTSTTTPTPTSGRRKTTIRLRPRAQRFLARSVRAAKASASSASRVRGVQLRGWVAGAGDGSVRLRVRRYRAHRWSTVRTATVSVDSRGRFDRTLLWLRRGVYRVEGEYLGSQDAEGSRSAPRRFRFRR